MTVELRKLTIDDADAVNRVSRTVWDEDYVPFLFEDWTKDECWHLLGLFIESELIGFGALQLMKDTSDAWVRGLRVSLKHQRRHYGSTITKNLIETARRESVKTLWYATGSRNVASMHLARSLGFREVNRVGYFQLTRPFPPHPTPSPNLRPLKVDAARLLDVLRKNPSLVEANTLPSAWQFERKNIEGIQKIGETSEFMLMIDEKGIVESLYYFLQRERDGRTSAIYSVFSLSRSMFVDVMARILDDLELSEIERAVFFLGPNATEWAPALMIVPEEYSGREYALHEMNL
ncbi:MAG: GNAT family N-acetyltransferase [Candidatus Thorarchaeota archaeon]|nr:MAG: GNAT family N-acetyltransferase [Candidatus Thorarchaeota archaeon]